MKPILTLLTALLLASHTSLTAADTLPQRPNVVVILADDLGYGDVQCYNPTRGKIPTPHLDKLAAQGMRFTDGHSSSGVCSPSRYTLLTGRYHWRTRLQSGIVPLWGPPLIAPDRMTIGTLAKQHGYRSAAIGKWHLGWDWPIPEDRATLFKEKPKGEVAATDAHRAVWQEVFSQSIGGGPTTRGFDLYFGTDVPNTPPFCFIENDRTVGIPTEFLPARLVGYNQANIQGPALAGWTLEPILPALGDRAAGFITESAKKPEPFLLYLPLTSPHTPLSVNEAWKGKSGLNLYADFVMETDALVGRVLEALERSGAADNTLVLFTADNGCAPYIGISDLEKMGHYPSGPLRGAKADAWEGGHRVPFIVRWPGKVRAGSVCDQLVQQSDLIATFAEALGVRLPDDAGEDSVSLMPLLKGGDQPVRGNAVSASLGGVPALRSGSWKYIPAPGSGGWGEGGDQSQPVQLYDLANDLGETKNLAAAMPEKVAEMKALLEKLITDGRSTPGAKQRNDVVVTRFPREETPKAKARGKVPKKKPNIILILADDLGYGGLGCYGQTRYQTPHLDRMAAEGARLTQFNCPAPFCAPTRASLLTGRYPFRCGMTANPAPDGGEVAHQLHLSESEALLPELLKKAGYRTGMFGKWHLGHAEPRWLPTHRGFEEYFGIPYSNDMRPVALFEGDQQVEYPVIQANLTKRYTARSLAFIEKHQSHPFFLYLAHAMPHKPLAVSEEFYHKSGGGLYGDAVSELDWSVGQVLAKLKELKLDENTLVMFTSDNGATFGGSTGGLRGMKGSSYEGGYRVPMIARWPGRIPPGQTLHGLAVMMDLFSTTLAAASLAPPGDLILDGHDLLPLLTEGAKSPHQTVFGHAGPRLATVRDGRWKLHVLKPGEGQAGVGKDLKPGERYNDPRGPDGVTILAPFEQPQPSEHPGLRTGDPGKPMQLFDLETDPGEQRDVAALHGDVVQRLKKNFDEMTSQLSEHQAPSSTLPKRQPGK